LSRADHGLLRSLRSALRDPDRGDAAVDGLRERYRWGMVDEFQDTDPIQWAILHRAFRQGLQGYRFYLKALADAAKFHQLHR
jgi:ATP-dependent exoDNAse (exonuclease V) beta subunit